MLFYDNVRAQHELVTKHLGITHARAVVWVVDGRRTDVVCIAAFTLNRLLIRVQPVDDAVSRLHGYWRSLLR